MKDINKLREEFEKTKTFEKCNHWSLFFDQVKGVYYSQHITYISSSACMNAAWLMFQELKK